METVCWQQISFCISFSVKFLSPCDKELHGRQEEEEDSIHVKSLIAAGSRGAWWASPEGIVGSRCCQAWERSTGALVFTTQKPFPVDTRRLLKVSSTDCFITSC